MSASGLDLFSLGIFALYLALLGALSLYGIHRWFLLWFARRPMAGPDRSPRAGGPVPWVTVQLPVFNERLVVEGLIDATCAIDWPRDRLEIQVLDDSTDDTADLVAERVRQARAQGFIIHHVRRARRHGYKAGALAAGLTTARGEFIAVFDADFVPPRNFLQATVFEFDDPQVGMVQARWGHLNRRRSWLTRIQAVFLDGHFLVDHVARTRSGCFFNFNGTAGIWRRRCIEDAGGWQADTLTEDLDLSYRAQLRGWRFVYRPDVLAPAELPARMSSFRSQQHRWAKGSIQTARKLLPLLMSGSL
ncbi:MAG: cellulose synthase family protein, partial [Acidobacteriota bacterium]